MSMFDQVKQAMQMRKEAKRIQSEMERITFEYSNGGITCVVRGDFSIVSIKIAPEATKEVAAGKVDRFETMLKNVIDNAIKGVKKQTQEAMMAMMKENGGGGLGGMFG